VATAASPAVESEAAEAAPEPAEVEAPAAEATADAAPEAVATDDAAETPEDEESTTA
jgi:hypothetical protein